MWRCKQGDDDLNEVTMKRDSTLYNWVRVAFNFPLWESGVGGESELHLGVVEYGVINFYYIDVHCVSNGYMYM